MIHDYIWRPEGKPIGVIQIVHGMTEYMGRYEALAKYFTTLGFAVCGCDLDGHGNSTYPGIPALHMESWKTEVDKLEESRKIFKETFGNIPYYALGFSLGSFLLRSHQVKFPNTIDKIVLVGTGMPSMVELKTAKLMIKLKCSKKKMNTPSPFIRSLAFESYNKSIPNALTDCDWLFTDPIALEQYRSDSRIQTKMTPKFFLEFLNGMIDLNLNEYKALAQHSTLPEILFIHGEHDPASKGLDIVEWRYKSLGAHVIDQSISDARHDVLHDNCKALVCRIICDFLMEEN